MEWRACESVISDLECGKAVCMHCALSVTFAILARFKTNPLFCTFFPGFPKMKDGHEFVFVETDDQVISLLFDFEIMNHRNAMYMMSTALRIKMN